MAGVSSSAQALWQRNIEADFGGFNGGAPEFFGCANQGHGGVTRTPPPTLTRVFGPVCLATVLSAWPRAATHG